MTNMDAIRKWSDEEFADFTVGIMKKTVEDITVGMGIDYKFPDVAYEQVRAHWLAWLKEEMAGGIG